MDQFLGGRSVETCWSGSEHFYDVSCGNQDALDNLYKLLDRDTFESLFGSFEFPVLLPSYTSDNRFYYFMNQWDGAFAQCWLDAFDKKSERNWKVKLFYWSLYSE